MLKEIKLREKVLLYVYLLLMSLLLIHLFRRGMFYEET